MKNIGILGLLVWRIKEEYMKSIIRSNIITNEKIIHDSKIEAKRLYEIAKEAEISIQKLGEMFGLKEIGKSKVRNRTGKVELKIYTIYELQEIKKQIKQEYKDVLEINQKILRNIQDKYKIGDKQIRSFFNISYNQLIKLKKNPNYQVKNTIGEEVEDFVILERYRYQSYLTNEDIQNMKKEFEITTKQIAKIFQVPIERVRNLEKGKTQKIKIYLYTKKDKEKIIKNNQKIIQKQKCTLQQLEKIIENELYDERIILEILGIRNNDYQLLKKEKIKTTTISDYEIKQRVDMCLLDMEKLTIYGRKEYQKEELKDILDKHNLTLEEFIQYSDKREEIRNMYQESIRNNQKIQMNSKTRMTSQFFEENFEEIQKRMAYCITNFCISHRCLQEKEDYIQDGYEFLMAEGGYIAENMKHDKEKCIKILCHRVVAQITKKHYQEMVTKRLNIEYQNIEIPDDCNRNYIDTRFSPEKILEEKEEIEEIHRVIVQNMKNNLNFASNMPKEFLKVLSYELGTEEEETEKLIEEIQLIILQNQLAKQDSKGRIIPINK